MTVCAGMLVKDEADIVGFTIRRLLEEVDHVIVWDNLSTDGTREILHDLALETDAVTLPGDGYASGPRARGLTVETDSDVAYYQAAKMTRMAAAAFAFGHKWFVPVDADEHWYATDGRTLRGFFAGLAPDVAFVAADLFNHLPTARDVRAGAAGGGFANVRTSSRDEANPFKRIGWRQREHGALPKVAARLRPGLEIRAGNHSAYAPGSGVTTSGLVVRHFSWRNADQYVRKIRNGAAAYAATSLPEDTGAHWRMFGDPADPTFDERVREHFATWFWIDEPENDSTLIYDPAPGA